MWRLQAWQRATLMGLGCGRDVNWGVYRESSMDGSCLMDDQVSRRQHFPDRPTHTQTCSHSLSFPPSLLYCTMSHPYNTDTAKSDAKWRSDERHFTSWLTHVSIKVFPFNYQRPKCHLAHNRFILLFMVFLTWSILHFFYTLYKICPLLIFHYYSHVWDFKHVYFLF